MNVGALELVLLAVVAVPICLVAVLTRKWWILGVIGCFAVAALATPPDVVTALLVGVPLSCAYALLALICCKRLGAKRP